MLKLIGKIFGHKPQIKNNNSSLQTIRPQKLDDLFLKHLRESSYFKDSAFDTVIKHLKNEVNLNKLGAQLTTNEKKQLGLNSRLSITTELVAALSKKGLELPNPKEALEQVYYRAKFEHSRIKDFNNLLSLGVAVATYNSCKDKRDCEWCTKSDGAKFTISEALNTEINQSCTCDWNRGFFSPEIEF